MKLEGKTVLITGGGQGIGQGIAYRLAEEGADIVIDYVGNPQPASDTVAQIQKRGRKALAVQADISSVDQIHAMMKQAIDYFGAVDILINNAGASWGAPAEEMRLEHWHKVIETNLTGTFLFSQAAGKVMIAQGHGKIISIASIAGMASSPDELQAIGYAASKGGIITMTRELARKWARHGIYVNAIAPGWFPTHMSAGVLERHGKKLLNDIPLGRFGGENDLKGAAVFLASAASDYVTGHVLVVDGGQLA